MAEHIDDGQFDEKHWKVRCFEDKKGMLITTGMHERIEFLKTV